MEPRIERLLSWAAGVPGPPTKIEYFPTFECNSHCIFCHRRALPRQEWPPDLPAPQAIRLVEESACLGVIEWHLIGGGEPLAAAVTPTLMSAIKQHGMYGYLNTNGQLFSHDLVRNLVKLRWDYIKISLHGHDAASHDHMTGVPGSFDRVIAALAWFQEEKRAHGAVLPRLEIGPVLNRLNFQHLPALVELAAGFGVAEFRPQAMTVYTLDCEALRLRNSDQEELNRRVEEVAVFAERHGMVTNINDFRRFELVSESNRMDKVIMADEAAADTHPFLLVPCYEPFYHLTIHSWGRVGICGFTSMDKCLPLAGKSLADIWYGPEFQAVRRDMLAGRLQDYCSHCVSVLVTQNESIRAQLRPLLAPTLRQNHGKWRRFLEKYNPMNRRRS
ncbi:radical SAM protein [bacterium]|nr:radical SAM protein [candidate division CSSED10-310 bacterium]